MNERKKKEKNLKEFRFFFGAMLVAVIRVKHGIRHV